MRTLTKVLFYLITILFATLALAVHASDPLRVMERLATRRIAIAGHSTITTDQRFYNEANTLVMVIQHDLGAKVAFDNVPLEFEALGVTNPETREVHIDQHLQWTARFETLTHEAGHLLAPPGLQTYTDREAYAEAVGGLTAFYMGDKDALQRSADFLTTVKGGLHVLTDYRQDILRAAKFLSGQ